MNNREHNTTHTVSILIIDDHPLIRAGLVQAVQANPIYRIAGEAASIDAAKRLTEHVSPQLILLDLSLEDGSGFDFLDWLLQHYPHIPVLVISMYEEPVYIKKAMQCGAKGYLFKRDSTTNVIHAIQKILQGKRYTSEAASECLLDDMSNSSHSPTPQPKQIFTKREYEVFELLGKGMSRKEAAAHLLVSPNTVESHIERMKSKLNLQTSAQLIYMAVKHSEPQV